MAAAWTAALLAGAGLWDAARAAETFADSPAVTALKTQYAELTTEHRQLLARQRDLLDQQSDLADQIEELQDQDTGLLRRMRLERLLAANLDVSNQLADTARRLAANEQARTAKRGAVERAYTAEMESVVQAMRHTADRAQAEGLAHRFYMLRQAREPWRMERGVETDFSQVAVEVEEGDGPDELLAKADMLTDLVSKIRHAILRLNQRIRALRREMRLTDEMTNMVKEMNLFEEGTRFVRRPEETTSGSEPQTDDDETDDAAVHVPPLDVEPQPSPGGERATQSVAGEIKRLENERAVLQRLADDLSARARALRDRAVELRREAGGAPESRPR